MYSLIAAMGNTVSSTAAGAEAAPQGSGLSSIIMIVLMVLIFYFLLIRPQKKRDKEAKDMMAALKKGDKIVTIGGIRGTVAAVTDQTVFVKVDDNVKIEFSKSAISSVVNNKPAVAAPEKKKDSKKKEEKVVEKPAEKVEEKKEEEKKEEKKPAKKASK